KSETSAIGNLGLELRENLAGRDRIRGVTSVQQNCNEMAIAFGVAAVEVYRALQFLEGPIIVAEMHRHIAEQGVSARTEIIQCNRFLRELLCALASFTGVLRPAVVRCAHIDLSQSDISGRVVRIDRDRALEQGARLRI